MKQGIIMEIQSKDAFVFTNDCSLVRVPASREMFVGQSIPLPEPAAAGNRQRRWIVPALAAACLVLLLSTGLLLAAVLLPKAGPVYLSLDINPSIEFSLDENRIVTAVMPLNGDAWQLLQDTNLVGLEYRAAIAAWVTLVRQEMPEVLDHLLISAVLNDRDRAFADQIMAFNGQDANGKLTELAGLNVRVLFTTDMAVKKAADANKLSIGKQMLLERAKASNLGLDTEYIRNTALRVLLQCLYPDEYSTEPTTGTLEETTAATTLETSAATTETKESATETIEVSTQETTPEPTKETTRETTKETTKPSTTQLILKSTTSSDGWQLSWTISPSSKELAYYKVVISKSDSTPKYPDNGYLEAISNRNEHALLVNNSRSYNSGDFGDWLIPGNTYYVGITYVFKDGTKSYSNNLHLTYNGPAAIEPTTEGAVPTEPFNPNLTAVSDVEGFHLTWDIRPDDRDFGGYKVVMSITDNTPSYPENGYVDFIPDPGQITDLIGIDHLTSGQQYYVAITYLFSDCKITSNVLPLTYIGPDTY